MNLLGSEYFTSVDRFLWKRDLKSSVSLLSCDSFLTDAVGFKSVWSTTIISLGSGSGTTETSFCSSSISSGDRFDSKLSRSGSSLTCRPVFVSPLTFLRDIVAFSSGTDWCRICRKYSGDFHLFFPFEKTIHKQLKFQMKEDEKSHTEAFLQARGAAPDAMEYQLKFVVIGHSLKSIASSCPYLDGGK